MSELVIKTGDTAPGQRVRLVAHDGTPADLTGATVVMQAKGYANEAFNVTVYDATDGVVHVARGTITVPDGKTSITLDVEFEVTYAGGGIQTFPEDGYERLLVYRDLDEE